MENKKELSELKKEWVKVINSFSDYENKDLWKDELQALDDKIKKLQAI